MALHALYLAGERHEHQKQLDEAFETLNEQEGRLVELRHAAVDGPYDRLMVSTVVVYETG